MCAYIRGGHYNESEMGTQAASKAMLTIEVGYNYNYNYSSLFLPFVVSFISLHDHCPPLPIRYFALLSRHVTYVRRFQLSFPSFTHRQCILTNIYFSTQPLDTCETSSSPSNTQLSSASYMSSSSPPGFSLAERVSYGVETT
jgi:hypothetical protein